MKTKNIRELVDSAIRCHTKEEARRWMEAEVKEHLDAGYQKTEEDAKKVILDNLGYGAGYYDQKTATKILELFGASHPFFGRDYFVEKRGMLKKGDEVIIRGTLQKS